MKRRPGIFRKYWWLSRPAVYSRKIVNFARWISDDLDYELEVQEGAERLLRQYRAGKISPEDLSKRAYGLFY